MDTLLSSELLTAVWDSRKRELIAPYEDALLALIERSVLDHDRESIRDNMYRTCQEAESKRELGVDLWWVTYNPKHKTRLYVKRDDRGSHDETEADTGDRNDVLPPKSIASILRESRICERLTFALKSNHFMVIVRHSREGTHTVRLEFFPDGLSQTFLQDLKDFAAEDAFREHLDLERVRIYAH